jgi:competence ComEA-like helix-hairpin-helix protein
MPPSERRALLLLLGLAVAGQAVRHLATRPGEPPGQVHLLSTLSPGSPLAQRDSAIRRARPLAPGERVDLDTAAIDELARLPKVGPGLAKTIHAYRQAHGSFGSLAGLDRVPGVGPGLLKTLGPHVSFSRTGRPGAVASRQGTGSCAAVIATLPLCPTVSLNLNTATAADLDSLPGIGPAKAAAILQYREKHGAFAELEDLAQVPGFGVGAVARLRDRVTVR